jgi:hypothetical protein
MNIASGMLWMKRNAYEASTTKKVAKLMRQLKRNCNSAGFSQIETYIFGKDRV